MKRAIKLTVGRIHRITPRWLWKTWVWFVGQAIRAFGLPEGFARGFAPFDLCELPEFVSLDKQKIKHNHDYLAWRIHLWGTWEPQVTKTILEYLPSDGVFVDVGANIGQHTIRVSRHCSHVMAIEPFPPNFEALLFNTKTAGNIEALNAACCHYIGTASLYYPPDEGDATRPRNLGLPSLGNMTDRSLFRSIDVQAVTLDSVGPERIDVLKIDVEGFEGAVLVGGKETIKKNNPVIIMEWSEEGINSSPFGPRDVWDMISELNYSVHLLDSKKLLSRFEDVPAACNLLLIPGK